MTNASFDNKKWDSHRLEHKIICERLKADWVPTEPLGILTLAIFNSSGND